MEEVIAFVKKLMQKREGQEGVRLGLSKLVSEMKSNSFGYSLDPLPDGYVRISIAFGKPESKPVIRVIEGKLKACVVADRKKLNNAIVEQAVVDRSGADSDPEAKAAWNLLLEMAAATGKDLSKEEIERRAAVLLNGVVQGAYCGFMRSVNETLEHYRYLPGQVNLEQMNALVRELTEASRAIIDRVKEDPVAAMQMAKAFVVQAGGRLKTGIGNISLQTIRELAGELADKGWMFAVNTFNDFQAEAGKYGEKEYGYRAPAMEANLFGGAFSIAALIAYLTGKSLAEYVGEVGIEKAAKTGLLVFRGGSRLVSQFADFLESTGKALARHPSWRKKAIVSYDDFIHSLGKVSHKRAIIDLRSGFDKKSAARFMHHYEDEVAEGSNRIMQSFGTGMKEVDLADAGVTRTFQRLANIGDYDPKAGRALKLSGANRYTEAQGMGKGLARLDADPDIISVDDDIVGVHLDGGLATGKFFDAEHLGRGLPRVGRFKKQENADAFKRLVRDAKESGETDANIVGGFIGNDSVSLKETDFEDVVQALEDLRYYNKLPDGVVAAVDTRGSSSLLVNLRNRGQARGYFYEPVGNAQPYQFA
jgi:hypothetical protein